MYSYKLFLFEKNQINIIKKFANVPEIYDWANEKHKKLAIWISNIIVEKLKKYINRNYKDLKPDLDNFLKGKEVDKNKQKIFKTQISKIKRAISNDLTKVLDFVNSPLHDNRPNLKGLSLKDAVKLSDEWHSKIESGGLIEDEQGEIIKTYDDGYYWIDLRTSSCKAEAKAMGHCGNTTNGTTLLSLRKNKKPHVTIGWDESENIFTQIKGKENTKPIEKFHKYIVDLICDLNISGHKSEYDREDDLLPEDLSKELFDKLEKCNPKYIENSKPMPDEEVKKQYREYLEDNIEEEATYFGNRIWWYITDNYLDEFIQNEISYYNDESEFNLRFDIEDVSNYIDNNVDRQDIITYLLNQLKSEYDFNDIDEDELEEYNEKVKEIKDDPIEYISDHEEDFTPYDLVEKFNVLDKFLNEKISEQYSTPEDVYATFYGDPDKITAQEISEYLSNYINYDKLLDDIMLDTDVETMRNVLNL